MHACVPLRQAPQHVPQSLQPPRGQRPLRGWVERLVSSFPRPLSLAWGEFMKDATRDEASQGPGRKRQTGCLGVEQSYPGVVVLKPASSMRTEAGFNNLCSQVLSQILIGRLVWTRKLKIGWVGIGAVALLWLLEAQCTDKPFLMCLTTRILRTKALSFHLCS